jgi:hypothetical protein
MLIWLLLYHLHVFGVETETTTEEYCFGSNRRMRETKEQLRFILVPNDSVQENNLCMVVHTKIHRRDLIQNYIKRLAPEVQIQFSTAESKRDPCQLKIEKIKLSKKNTQDGSIVFDSSLLSINSQAENSVQNISETITIQTMKDFEMVVNFDSIRGECRVISRDRYEIRLEIMKKPLPINPSPSSASSPLYPNPEALKDQTTSMLHTTVQLNSGEKLEVGSIVKNLKGESKNLDLNSTAKAQDSVETETEKFFLSINSR